MGLSWDAAPFVRGLKSLQTNPLGDAAGPSH
jgi:hypothetical protein